MLNELLKLLNYKAWANEITFAALSDIPQEELYKLRETNFKTIVSTMNHVYVVDDIFKAHLLAEKHGYSSRNTQDCPSLADLWQQQKILDQWYIDFVADLKTDDLTKTIHFEFVGGGHGKMTITEIVFHVVNHGTYHRGFVSDMMYQIPVTPPANDLTVYLRNSDNPLK